MNKRRKIVSKKETPKVEVKIVEPARAAPSIPPKAAPPPPPPPPPQPKQIPMGNFKLVKNVSLQGLELYLKTSQGPQTIWLEPRKTVKVNEQDLSSQVLTLSRRRLLRITNA